MSTPGVFSTLGGYHEYIRGCSVQRGFQWKLRGFYQLAPHMHHDIPLCAEHPPMYNPPMY